jgi:ABC-type transport system substrate-binding protein
MILERNKDYWRTGLPYVDGLERMIVKDTMTQVAALRAGEAHCIRSMDFEYADMLKKEGFNIHSYPELHIVLFGDSKNADSPLSKRKVREAVEYAIDRDGLSKMSKGYYPALYQMVLPDNPNHDPSLKPRKYDPVKAKKLLAEAGYPNGIDITIIYFHRLWKESWVYMQAKMAAAGIKLNLDPVQRGKLGAIRLEGGLKSAMSHMQLNMVPYPRYVFKEELSESSNFAPDMARPAGLDDLVVKSLRTKDPAENKAIFKQLNKMVYDDVMLWPLYVEPRVNAFHKTMKNYKTFNKHMLAAYYPLYMEIWLDKE